MVWPALLPPWNRTTISARFDSQSMILPLPSSPHWAPITVTLVMELYRTRINFCARQDGDGTVTIYSMDAPENRGVLSYPHLSATAASGLADVFPRQWLCHAGEE